MLSNDKDTMEGLWESLVNGDKNRPLIDAFSEPSFTSRRGASSSLSSSSYESAGLSPPALAKEDERPEESRYREWSSKSSSLFDGKAPFQDLLEDFDFERRYDFANMTDNANFNEENAMTKIQPRVYGPEFAMKSVANAPPIPESMDSGTSVDEEIIKLCDETEYPIIQRNGQRIYGNPPPNWDGHPPPEKGTEVFVGKIPRDCFENELVPLFSRVGKIYELRLMMDFSGSNRGYLFVKFTKPSEARRAIAELDNYEIRPGKKIGVCRSVDNRKLWISGLPKDRTVEEIQADLEKRTAGITRVILYPCQTDKTKTRPYAFVEYENHRAAALARRKLVPGRIFILDHEIEKVDWAQPEVEVDQEIMDKVKNLFVRNISPDTTGAQIAEIFEKLSGAKLERVHKTKDYAFVHFRSRETAEIALAKSKSLYMDGCLLDVSWSKPVDKDLYNTRKELTRMYSGGLPDIDFYDTNNAPVGTSNNCFGRGAPGTNPPRSLVQRMINAQQNLKPPPTDFYSQFRRQHSQEAQANHYYCGRPIKKALTAAPVMATSAPQGVYYPCYPIQNFYGSCQIPSPYVPNPTPPSNPTYVDPYQLNASMYQMSI